MDIGKEKGTAFDRQIIGVAHGMEPESYEKLKTLLQEELHVKGFMETRIGCAIGAHTGPGIVAFVYQDEINEKYQKYLDE